MKLHPILLEPEVQSTLFLLINFIGCILIRILYQAWPLSIIWTCFYLMIVFLINNALSSGYNYLPIKDLHGQTVIVTGAATGIGRVCARQFAKLGARVIIGIRGQERAEKIAKEISEESNGGNIIGYDFDLSSLINIKKFADHIDRVDILLNNAGSVQESYSTTFDGFEKQFGTNYLGHFYLTQLLLPLLKDSRVVNVSSLAHRFVKPSSIDYSFSKLRNNYDSFEAYGISKLALIYHASELTRRFDMKAYSLHPGSIFTTNLNQHKSLLERCILKLLSNVGKTIEQGAMTSLYCALPDDTKTFFSVLCLSCINRHFSIIILIMRIGFTEDNYSKAYDILFRFDPVVYDLSHNVIKSVRTISERHTYGIRWNC